MRKLTTLGRRNIIPLSLLIITSCGSNQQTENDRQTRGIEESPLVEKAFAVKGKKTLVKLKGSAADVAYQENVKLHFFNKSPNEAREDFADLCLNHVPLSNKGVALQQKLIDEAAFNAWNKIAEEYNFQCDDKTIKTKVVSIQSDITWEEIDSDYDPMDLNDTMAGEDDPHLGYIGGQCEINYFVTMEVSMECEPHSTESDDGTKVSSIVAPASDSNSVIADRAVTAPEMDDASMGVDSNDSDDGMDANNDSTGYEDSMTSYDDYSMYGY